MKVALCLSGQPRSFEQGYRYHFANLISKFDTDIYCHTWMYDFFDYGQLYNLYKPTKVLVEKDAKLPYGRGYRYCPYNVISSFYSTHQSIQLALKHSRMFNFEYDFIVRSRFDFALNFIPDFEYYSRDVVHVPESCRDDVVSDQFAIGSPNVMDMYSRTFVNIPEFEKRSLPFSGEGYTAYNLMMNNLWKSKVILDMNYPFGPGQYDGMKNCLIRDDFEFWKDK